MIYAAGALALGLIYIGWFVFGGAHRLTRHTRGWRVLIQVTLSVMFTILSVPTVDGAVNALVPYLPLSSLAKGLIVLPLCDLHLRMLVETDTVIPQRARILQWYAPLGWVLMLTSVLVAYEHRIPTLIQEYWLRGVRDVLLITFILSVFLPGHLRLYTQETVLPMRLKHGAQVLFLAIGAPLYVAGSIAQLAIWILQLPVFVSPYDLVRPIEAFCLLSFCLVLLPHRAFIIVVYPYRLWLFWRLRRVQHAVARWTGVRLEARYSISHSSLRLDNIELALYSALIFILDYFRELPQSPSQNDPRVMRLHTHIVETVTGVNDSQQLTRALAKITP